MAPGCSKDTGAKPAKPLSQARLSFGTTVSIVKPEGGVVAAAPTAAHAWQAVGM